MDQAAALRKLRDNSPIKSSHNRAKKRSTKIFAISSGKGGVGKSTITVNLGLSLTLEGKKVLIMDGDLGLANINVIMGIIPKHTLYHVIRGQKTLKEIILQTPEGLNIIPGASGYTQLADLDSNARENLMKSFSEIDDFDYILIDTGAGINSVVINLIMAADEVIIVTTPEPTSITDSYGLMKSIINRNKNFKLNVIINKAKDEIEGRKVSKRVVDICNKFLNVVPKEIGVVYKDEEVERSIYVQKPFIISAPKSKAADCIFRLSKTIIEESSGQSEDDKRLSGYLKKFFANNDNEK
jgi:flagellar biosynthesis protein FlhG